MSVIRASDIGNYLFCRRAWWYRKQGVQSQNQAELAAGTDLHRLHGRRVIMAGLTRALGYILLAGALILLVYYFSAQFG